jgi:DNA-binding LacI/PurR family transcriptional regulator
MKHATITDIAKRLGLSPSTISRALNNHPDIRLETKNLVKQVAKELRYSPNPIAQSLKSNRTSTIGVIVPEIKHDFFASAISGIEEVAYHSGYTIIVCQSNESFEREVVNTNVLVQHRVAGVLASISQQTRTGDHFLVLIDQKIPLVFFDRVCEDVPTSRVVVDDTKSAHHAVSFLVQKGYRRIAHFAGPRELNICKRRLRGYFDALNAVNMDAPQERVFFGGLHEADGYASMDAMLKLEPRPDAVFCVNDPVAIGAFQRIKEAGLRIPQDVALVGFSNNKISGLVDPPLTTVDQPSFEMGKRAAGILLELIECGDKTCEARTIVLETTLIIRGST